MYTTQENAAPPGTEAKPERAIGVIDLLFRVPLKWRTVCAVVGAIYALYFEQYHLNDLAHNKRFMLIPLCALAAGLFGPLIGYALTKMKNRGRCTRPALAVAVTTVVMFPSYIWAGFLAVPILVIFFWIDMDWSVPRVHIPLPRLRFRRRRVVHPSDPGSSAPA